MSEMSRQYINKVTLKMNKLKGKKFQPWLKKYQNTIKKIHP